MLKEFISQSSVKAQVKVNNWEEAIGESGKLLLEIGGIEQEYVDKMISNVKEYGPYIVVTPGVAIAHARPEDGVNFNCISVITLKNPICFGSKEFDPVKIVISLASKDNESHIKALQKLVEVIKNQKKLNCILETKVNANLYKLIV